jgi:glycosyltransferase involved in cell wall biosynthesis
MFSVSEKYLSRRRLEPLSLWKEVRTADVVFAWFASWHSFLPILYARLLGKPSILVIGGYDTANLPEIAYGLQRGGLKKWTSRATMRMADSLVTNSQFSETEARMNAGLTDRHLTVVYHGIPDTMGELTKQPRECMALTVGGVGGKSATLSRKGIEAFVRAAAFLPYVRFVVVGKWLDQSIKKLQSLASSNVEFTGWIDDLKLIDFYRRASVYVQVSRHEAFGMTVAEAMLAGCIPVVSNAGALPEVVGNCGVYCFSQEPVKVAAAIGRALESGEEVRHRARERVLEKFQPKLRAESLARIVVAAAPDR